MRRYASLILLASLASACSDSPPADGPPKQADSVAVTTAAKVPAGALKKVPWLLGTFRGTGMEGTAQKPFYERYRLADDSTLVAESLKDSTLSGTIETTRYELRHDSLTSIGSSRYVATIVSPDSIVFAPLGDAKNGFIWRRSDELSWTATIVPRGNGPRLTYRMQLVK